MAETLISYPKFAVVGHPNKGKSSIVSALAMDDSVQVSDTPGTTQKQRAFPLIVDGITLYELYDTPGFQRARRVLAWLQQHDVSADKRYEVVQAFIHAHKDDTRFNDEIQLLTPIMQGAGIIYVVDGSMPYGSEYEAEMEILRWTGQPSMALINHIHVSDYSNDWRRALDQYFKMVRTFNPMENSLSQHMYILESMAQLRESWVSPIKLSMKRLEQYHINRLTKASEYIAHLVYDAVSMIEKYTFKTDEPCSKDKENIEQKYKYKLSQLERDVQDTIAHIWKHAHLDMQHVQLTFDGMDLFSEATASVFGLTKKELMITGASSGAVTGAGIDLLFAGHTLLLGGVIGGLVGGVGAYFGFDELSEVKVLGQKLGQKYLQIGPMHNRNFPYILLGRALYHTLVVSNHSHANREHLSLSMAHTFKDKWLDEKLKKSLESYHKMFRAQKEIESETLHAYTMIIEGILKKLLEV